MIDQPLQFKFKAGELLNKKNLLMKKATLSIVIVRKKK
jgi:hypothetical protein